jgi:uncharacterized membrane protein
MKHPIHPILIPFPIGLWVFSFVADLVYLWRGNVGWEWMAYWTLLAGAIGAVAAAIFGLIDYFAIKDKEVGKVATWHMRLNFLALALFLLSWYFRRGVDFANPNGKLTLPMALSFVGVLALGIAGWFGGELVFKHGVGVTPQHDSREEEAAKARIS